MTTNHDYRNLLPSDVQHDTYTEWVDARLEARLELDRTYYHEAVSIAERGLVGSLFRAFENDAPRDLWWYLKAGDCTRCDEPGVGMIGVRASTDTPDGGRAGVGHQSVLCDDCVDVILNDYETHGELQPTIRGQWWGGEIDRADIDVPQRGESA